MEDRREYNENVKGTNVGTKHLVIAWVIVGWVWLAPAHWITPSRSDEPGDKSKELDPVSVYRELSEGLPKDGERAKSARLELEYWHRFNFGLPNSSVRKYVRTKDGKTAELLLLRAAPGPIPGTGFSMAFLLVERRIIDWASCWSNNRTTHQELQLEDVDSDGFLDVSFRADPVWFEAGEKRLHGFPGDMRKWLYAYAITSKGLRSLFPSTDQELKVIPYLEAVGEPVKLEIKGLPTSVREFQLVECTLMATNTSKQDLPIPEKWFMLGIEKGYLFFMDYRATDKRQVLKASETIPQVVRLGFIAEEGEKEFTLRFSFVPDR